MRRWRLPLVISLLSVLATALVIFLRSPTPAQSASILAERIVAGDIDRAYSSSLEKSRKIDSYPPELLKAFYKEFLEARLAGGKILSSTTFYADANKAHIIVQFETSSGGRVPFSCMAFVEQGEMRFPVFEAMLFAYAEIKYADVMPGLPQRVTKAWGDVGPWLLSRGVDRWYSSQEDHYYPISRLMPKK